MNKEQYIVMRTYGDDAYEPRESICRITATPAEIKKYIRTQLQNHVNDAYEGEDGKWPKPKITAFDNIVKGILWLTDWEYDVITAYAVNGIPEFTLQDPLELL